MRLAVVGASGTLGRSLAAAAAARGHSVIATYWSRPWSRPTRVRGVEWRQLDARDPVGVERFVRHAAPDLVINCAYVQRGPDLTRLTVDAAPRLAEAAVRCGGRLVQLSSDVVLRGSTDRPYREDDPPDPVHAYGEAKVAAEEAVAATDPRALVVRTSLIYHGATAGPQERLVRDALGGAAVTFFTDEIRCPIAVDDLARALLDLAAADAAGLFHVAGADALSRYDFACLLAAADGADPSPLRADRQDRAGEPRPGAVALDSAKASRVLGWAPRGAREVLSTRPTRSASD